ncbi:MAG: CHASE domain-containing protein, partial [Magnetococcales bacterium]|nr:CHASE domain-containing protein [Magnetococcales bacterium]
MIINNNPVTHHPDAEPRVISSWFIILSLVTTVFLFLWVRGYEKERLATEFRHDASVYVSLLEQAVDRNEEVIDLLGEFIATEMDMHGLNITHLHNEFTRFTRKPLKAHPDVRTLELAVRVAGTNRDAFEKEASDAVFAGFHITERQAQGELVPARQRPEYCPVYFVTPLQGNEALLGFDLASDPARLAALEQARDSGKMVTTGRIRLVQEPNDTFGFLMVRPFYRENAQTRTVADRRAGLAGYALGLFVYHDLVQNAVRGTGSSGIDIYLLDESASVEDRLLHFHSSGNPARSAVTETTEQAILAGIHWRSEMVLPERRWSVLLSPTSSYVAARQTWWAWIIPTGWLLLSALLGTYLYNQRRYTAHLNALSSALTFSNRALAARAACSRTIMDATEEYALLDQACQVLVETGGYRFAWVGFKENDAYKRVRPVGRAGHEDGYLKISAITWDDSEWGRGPTGTAIREGRVVGPTIIYADTFFEPWRHEASKRGYASSVSIPMILNQEIIGALNIYAAEPDSFQAHELNLLQQLTADLAFGLKAIREHAQRKTAEEALRNSQEHLQAILDNSPTVIYLKDTTGKFLLINTQYEKIFHVDRKDFIGKTDYELFPKHVADRLTSNDQEVLNSLTPMEFEEIVPLADGDHTYISVKFLVMNPQQTLGICGISTDITERKKLEAQLRCHHDELEATVAARTSELQTIALQLKNAQRMVHMGNWERDLRDGGAQWSEEIFKILGIPAQKKASFEQALQFVHPDDRDRVRKTVEESIQQEAECEVEYRLVRPDGEIRHVYSLGRITEWSDGRPSRMAGVLQDITARKLAEIELRQAKEAAEIANQVLAALGGVPLWGLQLGIACLA